LQKIIYQNIIELDEYLKKYQVANQISKVIKIDLTTLQKNENIGILKSNTIIKDNILIIIDCENKKINISQQEQLKTSEQKIFLINCENDFERVILKPFDNSKKAEIVNNLNLSLEDAFKLSQIDNTVYFLNSVKKIKILQKNETKLITELIEEDTTKVYEINNSLQNTLDKYQLLWIIKKYLKKDDIEIANIINCNPQKIYYLRKIARRTNIEQIEYKIKKISKLKYDIKSGVISQKIAKLKLIKMEEE